MAEVVLVTGAAGFIGRHVARALAAGGRRVVGLDVAPWDVAEAARWGCSHVACAPVSPGALAAAAGAPAAIVHCAGSSSVGQSAADPHACFERTVGSTEAVLEHARQRGAAVVLVSSGAVYGAAAALPTAETEPPRPVSAYAHHKRLAELLLAEHADLHGVPAAVVRLFSVYGPGLRKQLLWDACGKLSAGVTRFAGTGAETRDFLHVEDAAALLALAVGRAGRDCPVVNGGTGEAAAVADVLGVLAERLLPGARLEFTGEVRPGDPPHMAADVRRARAWGFSPARGWREGVAGYARWYEEVRR